jgi:hypothetical protein
MRDADFLKRKLDEAPRSKLQGIKAKANEPPRRKRTGYLVFTLASSYISNNLSCFIRASASFLSKLWFRM